MSELGQATPQRQVAASPGSSSTQAISPGTLEDIKIIEGDADSCMKAMNEPGAVAVPDETQKVYDEVLVWRSVYGIAGQQFQTLLLINLR